MQITEATRLAINKTTTKWNKLLVIIVSDADERDVSWVLDSAMPQEQC